MKILRDKETKKYIEEAKKICKQNDFKFISQIGRMGTESICFLVKKDNEKHVMKLPIHKDNDYSQKKKTIQHVEKIINNYKGNIAIPKTTLGD